MGKISKPKPQTQSHKWLVAVVVSWVACLLASVPRTGPTLKGRSITPSRPGCENWPSNWNVTRAIVNTMAGETGFIGRWVRRVRRGPPPLLYVATLCALAVQPFLSARFPSSADGKLHLYRLIELDHALRHGILFPRWAPDLVYGYGFPLCQRRWGTIPAVAVCAILVGVLTPWHTVGFAVTFALFGVGLWVLMAKTGSHLTPFLTLYLSYITHACLPWRGDVVTWGVIIPGSLVLAVMLGVAFGRVGQSDSCLSDSR